jgi:hypothetical protein
VREAAKIAAAISDLLWALETLAWSRDYLAPATALLARLTALDPGGRWGNRPVRSLREVFVLWCPQTNAPLQDRLKVLNRLRKIEPEVSWGLLLSLYPRPHDTVDPAPVPRWRDFTEEDPEPITDALYFSGAKQIGDWLLEDVGIKGSRWVQLIEGFDAWPPDLRGSAIKKLLASESKIADDDDRAKIQRALRALIHHHRQFEESDWSLPESELDELEVVYTALAPVDRYKKVEWLFENEQAPLLNPLSAYDWERNTEASNEERRAVISNMMTAGVEEIFTFARLVKETGLIGRALAQVADDATTEEVLARGILAGDDQSWNLAHGIIITLNFAKGNEWGDRLIDRAVAEGWGDEAILRILLSLPKSEHFMQKASSLGEQIDRLYWTRLGSHWIQGSEEAIASAIEKLLAVGRGRDCIHLAGHHLKGLPSSILVRILDGALKQITNSNDHNETSMFQYHVERIFQRLDEDGDVSESEMARLEWSYLNVLQRSKRTPTTLRKALSTTAQLFVQVLSVIYRPRKAGDHEEVRESEPVSEEQRKREAAIASHAYRLLNDWHEIPGRSGDKVDGVVLEAWVKDARILAADADRSETADQHIGRLFAYSPADDDGTWPCTAVRELIELVRSRSIERGFYLGVVNKRGATWRRPTDGGVQERELAKNYRKLAKNLRLEWPHTAGVLEQLSQHYARDGVDSDDDADRFQW